MCSSFQMPRSSGLMRPSGRTALRLGDHRGGPADGAAAKVHEVPVGREPVDARVLAHRGDDHAVAERQRADGERCEEHEVAT